MGKINTFYKGDMLFETEMGNHKIKIDVPPDMGGKDRGPTPPQLFIASLGSCVGAFVVNYCEKCGIDTEDLNIEVSFDKAADPTRLTNVKITVNIPKDDCCKKAKAIKRVAEFCPVHMTIQTLEDIELEIVGNTDYTD